MDSTPDHPPPTKMLDFVTALHRKYKVLNKLSEGESTKFQTQIIEVLVDSEENVDQGTLSRIEEDVGFEGFVL